MWLTKVAYLAWLSLCWIDLNLVWIYLFKQKKKKPQPLKRVTRSVPSWESPQFGDWGCTISALDRNLGQQCSSSNCGEQQHDLPFCGSDLWFQYFSDRVSVFCCVNGWPEIGGAGLWLVDLRDHQEEGGSRRYQKIYANVPSFLSHCLSYHVTFLWCRTNAIKLICSTSFKPRREWHFWVCLLYTETLKWIKMVLNVIKRQNNGTCPSWWWMFELFSTMERGTV